MHIIGDIGGTWMRIAGYQNGSIGKIARARTPKTYEEFVSTIFNLADEAVGDNAIDRAVIGVAGLVDGRSGTIVHSPNISYLDGKELANDLADLASKGVYLENDACLSALAEARKGSGALHEVVAYISIGTGVGGARIDRGEIDKRSFGFEPGHHVLDMNGGDLVEWESLVSGKAIEKKYGKPAVEITDDKIWKQMAHVTAIGVYNTMLFWSPDIVVMGGAMMTGKPAISLELIRAEIECIAFHPGATVPFALSTHGDTAGLVGASLLL